MSLVVFQHDPKEDASLLGKTLQRHGHRLRVIRLWAGEHIPLDLDDVDGLVIMGGPMNVDQTPQHPWLLREMDYLRHAHQAGLPILGVCLGHQLIAQALGGKVEAMPAVEVGFAPVQLTYPGTMDPILAGIPWQSPQFHMHGQHVSALPPGATTLAGTKACRIQAFCLGMTTYAFQYHFEWTRQELLTVFSDPLFAQAGLTDAILQQQIEAHYALYQHLGERLCTNLATCLFPIDKRLPAVTAAHG
ncbi:MAG: type 1 glutamine amidotransferase [Phycisphaeraceae bacterium]|nr:type 1 glutamine amidotransferase [Phycisphaeraceae bacterium]